MASHQGCGGGGGGSKSEDDHDDHDHDDDFEYFWNNKSSEGGGPPKVALPEHASSIPTQARDNHDMEFARRLSKRKTQSMTCDQTKCNEDYFCLNAAGMALCKTCATKAKWEPTLAAGVTLSRVWDPVGCNIQFAPTTNIETLAEQHQNHIEQHAKHIKQAMGDFVVPVKSLFDHKMTGREYPISHCKFHGFTSANEVLVNVLVDLGFDMIHRCFIVLHNVQKLALTSKSELTSYFESFLESKGKLVIVGQHKDTLRYHGNIFIQGTNIAQEMAHMQMTTN